MLLSALFILLLIQATLTAAIRQNNSTIKQHSKGIAVSSHQDEARKLLFGAIFSPSNTRTLVPVLYRECFNVVEAALTDQAHPLVFACAGNGNMRTSFNLAPHNADRLSIEDTDKIIVQTAYGNDCLYTPNPYLFPQAGCHSKFTKFCKGTNMQFEAPIGPACVIVYCDNPWSECRVSGRVDIFQSVQIKEREDNEIDIGDGAFEVHGQGFALDADDNRVKCADEESYAIECRVTGILVEDASRLKVETYHPFGRESLGPIYVSINVVEMGWTEWVMVGTLIDQWPIELVRTICYIVALVLAGCFIAIVIRVQYMNTMGQWLFDHTAFGRAMKELDDPEEALRFEGYFTGIRRNWEERNASRTGEDAARAAFQNNVQRNEEQMRDEDGLVFL